MNEDSATSKFVFCVDRLQGCISLSQRRLIFFKDGTALYRVCSSFSCFCLLFTLTLNLLLGNIKKCLLWKMSFIFAKSSTF